VKRTGQVDDAQPPTQAGHARARQPDDSAPTVGTMTTEGGESAPLDGDPLGHTWEDAERYALIQEIASGGGGRISIALDRKLGRRIAVKRPVTPGAARRLEREALVMARLEHPSIVPVHDAGRDLEGTPFYAMKLLRGPNLSERLRGTTTFEQRIEMLRIVGAVADAMAYAHTRGVIHRDLKPGNVVVGEFGEVAVIDWGLAKMIGEADLATISQTGGGELTSDGDVVGTPAYMAPEQAYGEPVDARADVYALGAILYHVLAGELPYGRVDGEAQLARLRAGPPPRVEDRAPRVPPDLAAIVAKAMAREPEDRYPTARELAEDLHRYETGRLVAAHRYSPWARARRWARRRVALLATAAAIVATGGAIALAATRHEVPASTCVDLDRPAAAAWSADARAAIARAFGGRAAASERAVEGSLDARASSLTAMRTEACRARENGEQSQAVVDERMACLDARIGELRAVAGAIAGLRPDELPQAEVMLGAIGAAEDCADLRRLRDAPQPSSPVLRAEVLAVDEQLTKLDADDLAGRVRAELGVAPVLVTRALTTGHEPLIAHALEQQADALLSNGKAAAAEPILHEAAIASAGAGDDHRRGRVLLTLAQVVGREHGRAAEAESFAEEAAAIADRLKDHEMRVVALARLASLAGDHGDLDRAVGLARQVVALDDAAGATVAPIHRIQRRLALGRELAQAGRYDEGHAAVESALRDLRALVGPDHESIAQAIDLLGTMEMYQGRYSEAEAHIREGGAMLERILGPDAWETLNTKQKLAELLKMQDRFAEAAALLDDVRTRFEKQTAPNPETLANVYDSLASVLALQSKFAPALDAYRRALALRPDPSSHGAGMDRSGIGTMLNSLHRAREALPELEAAVPVLENTEGADGFYAAWTQFQIGDALLAGEDARGAIAAFERARPGLTSQGDDHDRGVLAFDRARAEWQLGQRSAAIADVSAARASLTAGGADAAASLRELDAWSSAHRPSR
jgi:tetratricopeptide (TPR) repeat protein